MTTSSAISQASFLRIDVLATCHEFGQHLKVPPGVVGWQLMAAIASNESSLGANCGPRHEPAYDVGGSVYDASAEQRELVAQYPSPQGAETPASPAACSYGPWQTMLMNSKGYPPGQLLTDLDACADAFVAQFNNYVIGVRKAASLEEIGEVWNMGHVAPDLAYTQKLATAYAGFA